MKFVKIFFLTLGFILTTHFALAANVTVSEDVTMTVGGYSYTLSSTSNALDQLEVTSTSIIITTNLSLGDVTIRSADRINLGSPYNSLGLGLTSCQAGESILKIQASQSSVRTATIIPPSPTASDFLCSLGGSGAGGGPSGGGGSGSTAGSSSATNNSNNSGNSTTEKELPYYQLPEQKSKGAKVLADKDVKFPTSGKVTKQVLMKNNDSGASYLLKLGTKVTSKGDKKAYTGFVTSPKKVAIETLPGLSAGDVKKVLGAIEVKYDGPVKIAGLFQLKMPLGMTADKAADKKRFKIYYYDTPSGKWKSITTKLSKNLQSVYVNTGKYGYFMLMDKKGK